MAPVHRAERPGVGSGARKGRGMEGRGQGGGVREGRVWSVGNAGAGRTM